MISEIKMRNCAAYDADGVAICDCKKVNFIYGPNGSGKSTVSNFMQSPTDPLYAYSEIVWGSESHSEVMVYNRRFREQNFSGSNIAGVFTLGKATIEEINALDHLKNQKTEKEKEYFRNGDALKSKETSEKKHKDDFRDTIWNVILKARENEFQDAFEGLRKNKEKFRDELVRRFILGHDSPYLLADLQNRAKTLYASKPESCRAISISVDSTLADLFEIETNDIWQKVIVGNSDIELGKLIKHLDNVDWVNQGQAYLSDNICPFCQQPTISTDFTDQLSQFFSKEYEAALSNIAILTSKYEADSKTVISSFMSVLEENHGVSVANIDVAAFKIKIELYAAQLQENLSVFVQKKSEPSRKFDTKKTCRMADELTAVIRDANDCILKHNQLVANYHTEREKLSNDIWEFLLDEQEALISGYLSDLNNFAKAKKGISDKRDSLKTGIEALNIEIIEAGKNITSVQPTVDEINRLLKAYGFQNFQIAPSVEKENHYQIRRPDGTLASNTLSEGEETFITFLYFMQLAKGATDSAKVSVKKVLVLDDPICSLDSTILYIVSTIVKQTIREIKQGTSDAEQIFILTHNVFFHKEVSFIDGRTKVDSNTNYWIIHKNMLITQLISYGQENPISTSYELMWRELKGNSSASLVSAQNTMRRIIENYYGMLGNKKYDYIAEQFETAESKIICQSLFCWINDGSHSIPDDLYIDSYSDSMEKYKEVFHQVFVKTGHEAHYNIMMGIDVS